MIKLPFLLLLAALQLPAAAQYYYKDILSIQQLEADKVLYKTRNIRTIEVHSYEASGEPSKGFFCEKKISKSYRQIDTYTKSILGNKSLLSSFFNDRGQLVKSVDSSELNVSVSEYEYNTSGNLLKITTRAHSSDDDFVTAMSEVHQYSYDSSGRPQKMQLIRNGKDTVQIVFTLDSAGNVIDEADLSADGARYYYYYDAQHRLTDIAHFNPIKRAILPDFIFQYNGENQLVQMIVGQESASANYVIWSYSYDNGLRIKEKCYSSYAQKRQLMGYFEYEYL